MTPFWELEQTFRDAWPALDEIAAHGWLARLTGGDTRRPNAINPLGPDEGDIVAAITALRPHYAQAGLRMIVRVPDFCAVSDRALEQLGMTTEGRTHTIAASLGSADLRASQDVEISSAMPADWLVARVGPQGDPATAALLARLAIPTRFATVRCEGVVAAIGFVAIRCGYGVIESIRTMPQFQRRGLGQRCVYALMAAAADAGAHTAALQVDAANGAGLALYATLGFDQHLYDYHYRVPA